MMRDWHMDPREAASLLSLCAFSGIGGAVVYGMVADRLGGGKVFFVGNALVDLFLQSRNWAYGSAVAVALVAVMLLTVTLYMRFVRRFGADRDDVSLM